MIPCPEPELHCRRSVRVPDLLQTWQAHVEGQTELLFSCIDKDSLSSYCP
nr:MAG TPA: hypothetical protein [Bacteriophage sp.]